VSHPEVYLEFAKVDDLWRLNNMATLIEGWINPELVISAAELGFDPDIAEEIPDELAFSLVIASGDILRMLSDQRPDDADVNKVIAEMTQSSLLGSEDPALNASPEMLGKVIFTTDAANRYVRILAHCMGVCLDYTPDAGVSEDMLKDHGDASHLDALVRVEDLLEAAAQEAAKLVSPSGLMMMMMLAALNEGKKNGMPALLAVNVATKFSEGVLRKNLPVVPRIDEGEELVLPDVHFTSKEVRQNLPSLDGSFRFLKAMKWDFAPYDDTPQTVFTPIVGRATTGATEVFILSAGYSPIDKEGNFAVGNRKALTMEMTARNVDILAISTKPASVEREGTFYSVIGEAFVRVGDQKERTWRPAVAWPACKSVGELTALARSAHFNFNEVEYADPAKKVVKELVSAMKSSSRKQR
jgi:hypothetical protein